jgi:hypothetical protein
VNRVFPKNTFKWLHDLLIAKPGSLVRLRVLQVLLPKFGHRNFNRLCIFAPLDFRNP